VCVSETLPDETEQQRALEDHAPLSFVAVCGALPPAEPIPKPEAVVVGRLLPTNPAFQGSPGRVPRAMSAA